MVYIYSGLGLLEDTSVSAGRGTTKPFQMVGDPKVNAHDMLTYFQNNVLPILFRIPLVMERLFLFERHISSLLLMSMWVRFAVELRFI